MDEVDPQGNNFELKTLLESWQDFVFENYESLENGKYKNLRVRPVLNYKQILTQEVLTKNIPDLEKDKEQIIHIEQSYQANLKKRKSKIVNNPRLIKKV